MSVTVRRQCECGETLVADVDGAFAVLHCAECGRTMTATVGRGGARAARSSRRARREECCASCVSWLDGECDEPGAGVCTDPDSPRHRERTVGGDWCELHTAYQRDHSEEGGDGNQY